MQTRKFDYLAYLILVGCSLLYCHRFLGFYCLETDLIANVSYRLNETQFRQDYNPYQWDYASWMPFIGLENPFIAFSTALSQWAFPKLSEVARAYLINSLTSAILLSLFACSLFAFFRYCGRTVGGAFAGSVLVAFTGFQLTGVRLFNHMYLLSFCAVCPVWYCFIQISQNQKSLKHALLAGLCIGISLLGGSNSPLFYYLPCFLLLPLLQYWRRKPEQNLWQVWDSMRWMWLSGLLALFVGSAVLFPGIYYLEDTNRNALKFIDSAYVLNLAEQLRSLVFRDWGWTRQTGYYESDCYFGIVGLFLVVTALVSRWRTKERRLDAVEDLALFCFLFAILILNLHQLPLAASAPISRLFESLSIRNSSRFFMLALIPLGYWAAKGFDLTERKITWRLWVGTVALVCLFFSLFNGPTWNSWPAAMKLACLSSLTCGLLSFGLIGLRSQIKAWRTRFTGLALGLLYFSQFFAPIPQTNYGGRLVKGEINKAAVVSFFNFRGQYSELTAALDRYLRFPPKHLQGKESYRGRIWDPMESAVLRTHYFATRTHHRMAFSSLNDLASSRRLREYFFAHTEPMMDLYQVCSEVKTSGNRTWLSPRKTCLPEAFLVSHLTSFPLDSEVLGWLQNQTSDSLMTEAAVYCSGSGRSSCVKLSTDLLADEGVKVKAAPVVKLGKGMQNLVYNVKPGVPSLLFLSVPYRRGWIADVDGVRTEVIRVNHAFMGVPLNVGAKQVALRLDQTVLIYSRAVTRYSLWGILLGLIYLGWKEKNLSSIFQRRRTVFSASRA